MTNIQSVATSGGDEDFTDYVIDKVKQLKYKMIVPEPDQYYGEQFDILIVKKGNKKRTLKILFAIARGVPIVTEKWLEDKIANIEKPLTSYYHSQWSKAVKKSELCNSNLVGKTNGTEKTLFQGFSVKIVGGTRLETDVMELLVEALSGTLVEEIGDADILVVPDKYKPTEEIGDANMIKESSLYDHIGEYKDFSKINQ